MTSVRWMNTKTDLGRVMEIDRLSYDIPWGIEQWRYAMKDANTTCMVAERDGRIAGVMVYHKHESWFELWSLAVHPQYRRQGVGASMINKMRSKMRHQPQRGLTQFLVSDQNTIGHLFLKACGFQATRVVREHFEHPWHGSEDAYEFHLFREPFAAELAV